MTMILFFYFFSSQIEFAKQHFQIISKEVNIDAVVFGIYMRFFTQIYAAGTECIYEMNGKSFAWSSYPPL